MSGIPIADNIVAFTHEICNEWIYVDITRFVDGARFKPVLA